MSNIKPTRAQMFNGLRKRPTYEEISQEINPDNKKKLFILIEMLHFSDKIQE